MCIRDRVQMSLSSRYVEHGPEEDLFGIRPQGDDLDPVREDAAGILRFQYAVSYTHLDVYKRQRDIPV